MTEQLTIAMSVLCMCAIAISLVALAFAWDANRRAQTAQDAVRLLTVHRAEPEPPADPEPEPEAVWVPPVLRLVEAPPMTPQARVAQVLESIASEREGEAVLGDDVLHELSTEEHLAANAAIMEVGNRHGRLVTAYDDVLHRALHLRWRTPE